MTETEDGQFYSLADEQIYPNHDGFISKREEVEENTGVLAE